MAREGRTTLASFRYCRKPGTDRPKQEHQDYSRAIITPLMPLAPGIKLGPYEIIALLGAGGMGEVYRARDSALGREVAVKILQTGTLHDLDRLRRFRQEAQATASLNHPNILSIYFVGEHEGTPFIVSELLKGESLRERMRREQLPVRKCLEIARQIIQGLAAAHEKGIVHRDLKPENIFLTEDGPAKILDFGLAKLVETDNRTADPNTATVTQGSAAGVVLGTVGYMSPEQVRGGHVDSRSDIFAMGAILYEMLSGKRAFSKDSSAETMAAILKEEPAELSDTGRKIPPGVERIIFHCLEKNPVERFQSTRDLAFDLESLSGISAVPTAGPISASTVSAKWLIPLAALFLLAVVLLSSRLMRPKESSGVLPTFQQLTFQRGFLYSARFAPDGKTVVYSASWEGRPPALFSTRQDSPESRPLEGDNTILVAVSPFAEMAILRNCLYLVTGECTGILAREPLSGGAPRDLIEGVNSADWSADGNQLAVTRLLGGKFRAEFPQGKPLHETADEWLGSIRLSPQGNAVALTEHPLWQGDAGKVVVYAREGKELVRSPAFWSVEGLAWSPRGDEIWFLASKDQQWANELHALSLSGQDRIILRLPGILRLHDVSRDGRLLLSREIWRSQIFYRGPGDLVDRDLSWLDYSIVTDISTDGQELAFSEEGEATRNSFFSYTRKKDGSPAVKLGMWGRPVFSPDRKSVVAILGTGEQLVVLPTGVGEVHELNPSSMLRFSSPGWQPSGKGVFYAGNDGHGWRIYTKELSGGDPRAITPLVSIHPERFESNVLSYDGKYVVARNLDGAPMMYSVDGAEPHPIMGMDTEDVWINWSRDGRSGYIFRWGEVPGRVFRLDLSSGKKQLITTLLPSDQVGVTTVMTVRMTPDGKSYAYTSERALSELFLVSGAK